jgi:ferredoxin
MLPYTDQVLQSWPISTENLNLAYKFISDRIPISGKLDSFASEYEPYLSSDPLLPTSRILRLLEESEKLNQSNFMVGSSRLAVYSRSREKKGCHYCALCLSGCPTNQIWSAPKIKSTNLNYKSNSRVLSLAYDKRITLKCVDINGSYSENGDFEKVFIGAGNIETFRILATSNLVQRSVVNLDSATFFLPFFLSKKYKKVEGSRHTLSQAFIRIKSPAQEVIQLQIYDFAEDLVDRSRRIIPLGGLIPRWILSYALKRLFIAIGYLDSEKSPQISMKLSSSNDVELKGIIKEKNQVQNAVKKMIKANRKSFLKIGLSPLPFLTKYALPGEGVHSGGWLPMGKDSDSQGRPMGSSNIHVIDSSVFPTIPPGAITFSVMANAVRIVEEACS